MDLIQKENNPLNLDSPIFGLLLSIQKIGGRPLFVGGWVRDKILGIKTGDVDIEVFGLPLDTLKQTCQRHGRLVTVGASFAVLKLTLRNGITIDISVPRRERLTGQGHKAFNIQADPFMTVEEAAQRRDLTVNAISMDPFSGKLIDPVKGADDLEKGVLRHIGPRFREDPLRVLRVYRFQARFGFEIALETRKLCQELSESSALQTLARERIEDELRKMILDGEKTGTVAAMKNMYDDGIMYSLLPELHSLAQVEQDPKYHAEGNVLIHTILTVAEAASIARRDMLERDIAWALSLAALIHDLGKASATITDGEGNIKSHGHDKAGRLPATTLLNRITEHTKVRETALALATNHMRPLHLAKATKVTDAAIRRLAVAVQPASLSLLSKLVEADTQASIRGDGSKPENAHLYLMERAKNLGIESAPPKPIIQGRDLIQLATEGIIPKQFSKGGIHFAGLLKTLYHHQLNGKFSTREDAIITLQILCKAEKNFANDVDSCS